MSAYQSTIFPVRTLVPQFIWICEWHALRSAAGRAGGTDHAPRGLGACHPQIQLLVGTNEPRNSSHRVSVYSTGVLILPTSRKTPLDREVKKYRIFPRFPEVRSCPTVAAWQLLISMGRL